MNISKGLLLLLRNTILVTAAVVLGFMFGAALRLPVWLHGFCLLPAIFLFYWLDGQEAPSKTKILIFVAVLSAIGFVFTVICPQAPYAYRTIALLIVIASIQPVTKWIEQRNKRP